jgi:hypothetical protein
MEERKLEKEGGEVRSIVVKLSCGRYGTGRNRKWPPV